MEGPWSFSSPAPLAARPRHRSGDRERDSCEWRDGLHRRSQGLSSNVLRSSWECVLNCGLSPAVIV